MKICVGVLTIEIHLPESQSLKDRRSVIGSIKERVRKRFNVSIAEADCGEVWQRAELIFSCAGSKSSYVDETLTKLRQFIDSDPRGAVFNHDIRYYE